LNAYLINRFTRLKVVLVKNRFGDGIRRAVIPAGITGVSVKADPDHRSGAYTPRAVQLVVQDAAKRAGLAQRVTPHRLRASVATLLLDTGMPIDQVQKFLRHKHLSTTQIYAETIAAAMAQHVWYIREPSMRM
jgi:integrase